MRDRAAAARLRRSTVVALAIATACSLLGDYMLYTVLPSRRAVLGVSVAMLGVVLSIHRFVRLIANSFGGLLYDRFGRRQPFLLGVGLAFVSTTGYLVAWNVWPLLVARVVWGVAFALISVGAHSILLDVTTPGDRGRTLGVYQAFVNCGMLLGFAASGLLGDLVGFRGTLAIFAPVTAAGGVVAFAVLRETAPGRPSLVEAVRASRPAGRAPAPAERERKRFGSAALDRRLFLPYYVSFAVFFAGNGVLMATLGNHLQHVAAARPAALLAPVATLTGALLALRKFVGIVAAPVSGVLSDRSGDRRAVGVAGAVLAIIGFAVLAVAADSRTILAGVALGAIGEAILLPAIVAWAGDLTAVGDRGATMGGLATANDLGGAIGPLVGYALAATLGLRWAYALSAALLLSAAVALTAGRRTSPRLRLTTS